ncbi:hypothetical protein KXV85_004019, partial [Aspergillus fumigatus]
FGRTRRRHRSGSEAQDHRPPLHRGVRTGGEEDRRRRFPRAGHALPRRDRERLLHRRTFGHHQVAPQCRWPPRAHEHEARRALARTLQGRGPQVGPRTGPARNLRRPPPVPGPGPRHPLPRRDHQGQARHPAQGRCGLHRPDQEARPLRRNLAGLRRAAAGEDRRRDGRRPHLRLC